MKNGKWHRSGTAPNPEYHGAAGISATTGQNAMSQVEYFNEAVGLDGIVLTKLDGTSKGGIIVSIVNELKIPVCYVGVGEGIDDLLPFNAEDYVNSIL